MTFDFRESLRFNAVAADKETRFGWAWTSRTKSLPYICEINKSEVYRIFQRDRDFSYGSPSTDPNDWLKGPTFVYQSPSTVFVGRESQVHIECTAKGNPSPSYKWFKDYGKASQKLIVATDRYTVTNGRLTISQPREAEDAGEYTCVAHNSVGSVFSRPILVAEGHIDEFSNDKPGARTAVLYQGAVVDCSPPAYNPAVVFQWMKDSQFIRPQMNPHTFLSENGKLYFSEVQSSDAAQYHCIITLVAPPGEVLATSQPQYRNSLGIPLNIYGENANKFGPDVHDDFPAVFPKQPLRGQEMRLECLAYGRLPLYYSWSRVDGGRLPLERISFSSVNRVIKIQNAHLEDSGVYMCTVQGPVNTRSKNISVSVSAVPYFKYPLRNQHLDRGSRLTWVCDAVAIPRATYAWYRNGQLLVTDAAQDIQVQGNVLTISSADADKHDGMYECMAWNDLGKETSIAQIRVLAFQPNFNKQPVHSSLMGAEGGNVTVQCRPEAAPQPVITWSHNGSPLVSSASGHARVTANGNLELSGLTRGDEGTYTCTAENALGKAESSGKLTVLQRTTLSTKPEPATVSENSTAHIPCQASYIANKTDLVYAWYFNGKLLNTDYEPAFKVENYRGIHGLYVIGAQFEHEGWYECRAVTVYDRVSAQAYLTVMGSPGEPAGVHVKKRVGTEVTLWWQRGREHGDPITHYRVEFSSNYDASWRILRDSIPASETPVTEKNSWHQHVIPANILSPGTSYTFRVSAASANFGFGPHSKPSDSVKLEDAAPIYPVDTISGGGGSVGMLRVKWLPLAPEKHGGAGVYYKVYYRQHRLPDDMWRPSKPKEIQTRPDHDGFLWFHHMVGETYFYTEYDVKVQVFNSIGPGPNSSEEVVVSAEDIPITTPQNVNAEGINATAGLVTWDLPNNTREGLRGKVLGYQLNWWPWGGKGENCDGFQNREIIRFIRVYGQDRQGVIIGLFANGNYWVTVQVFNSAGLSRPSGCNHMNSNFEAPLLYPEYVRVTSHGPESVEVSWRGISTTQVEYGVNGFKVWYWPYTEDIRTAKVAAFPKVFSGVLHGIERDIIYKLRVLGTNYGGDGKKSPPTYFTLGGQVMFDPRTSEIMASAALLKPSSVCLLISLSVFSLFL
ncbi:contactin-like [Babylonia areolata]|uniref:contactin-like n=1 Tax=Babylonia areolata TaxID=304850 RepID=UPI003FD4D80B